MRVSELYGKFSGAVFVLGSGPSNDVFPMRLLEGKTVCLLNDSQKFYPHLGPIAFANNRQFLDGCNLPYRIVKGRLKFDPHPERTDNHVAWSDPDLYVFSYRDRNLGDDHDHFDWSRLWAEPDYFTNLPGGNCCIFACQALILMGFTEIYLVGCDCRKLGRKRDYHAGKRSHRTKHDYASYAEGEMRMIREGRKQGCSIVTLSPFAGLGREERQYEEMCQWDAK